MSTVRIGYRYVSMVILAAFLLGVLGFAAGTRQWVGMGLAVVALIFLALLVPRARRQRSSRT